MHPNAQAELNSILSLDHDAQLDLLLDSVQDGICTSCGAIGLSCEPDAEGYTCENCGEPTVSSPAVLLGII